MVTGEDAGGEAGGLVDEGAVNQAVADSMRGALEQLSRTLALYLKYHAITFRGPGPDCIHLMGVEADNEMLRASLSIALGRPVVTADPFSAFRGPAPHASTGESTGPCDGFDTLTAGGFRAADWVLATGLALKRLPGGGQAADLPPAQAFEVKCA